MKLHFIADDNTSPTIFFPVWGIMALMALVMLLLIVFFPRNLYRNITTNHRPSLMTLSYLNAFRTHQPLNKQLTLSIIEQDIAFGLIHDAQKNRDYLERSHAMTLNESNWIHYCMLRYRTSTMKLNTEKRILNLRILRQMIVKLSNQTLEPYQSKRVAEDALTLKQEPIALHMYQQLMTDHALTTADEFARGGEIAMQNNDTTASAHFYWAAYQHAIHVAKKRQYALKTMQSLLAGNHAQQALLIAHRLPDAIQDDRDFLVFLTQLAIAANHPDQAEKYIEQALSVNASEPQGLRTQLQQLPFDPNVFHVAYQAFLYNSHLSAAYAVALVAVEKNPDSLLWHHDLAQSATWALDYNKGMQEWLYVLHHSRNQKTIQEAMSTAKTLGYDDVLIRMLTFALRQHPNDTHALIELASAQNRLFKPKQAIHTLQALIHQHPTPAAYRLMATIYQNTDHWNKALNTLQHADKQWGATTHNALIEAEIYYHRNQFKAAINALKQSIKTAKSTDLTFWDLLADLSWMINDRPDAILGYRMNLSNASHFTRLIELEKVSMPRQALQHSITAWYRFHVPLFFSNAFYLMFQLHDWQLMHQFIAHLTPKEQRMAENMLVYWQAQAQAYHALGRDALQNNRLMQGITEHPDMTELKNDLLWSVLAEGNVRWINALLSRWYPTELVNLPAMWQAFAQGFALINQNSIALQLYQNNINHVSTFDHQPWIDYANLLSKMNYHDRAYVIRRNLLQHLLNDLNDTPQWSALKKNDLQALSQLAIFFLSGTDQWNIHSALLKQHHDSPNRTKELREHPQAHDIDHDVIQRLNHANSGSLREEHEAFVTLAGFRTQLESHARLTHAWDVNVRASVWNVHSTQPSSITNVPTDTQAGIAFKQTIQRGYVQYTIGFRQALASFVPLDLDFSYQLSSRWHGLFSVGLNQENFQTPALRLGGVQDQVNAQLIYNLAQYDRILTELDGLTYYSQNRHYLGNGVNVHGLFDHKLWLSYPDFTASVFTDLYFINRNGTFGGDITHLFPPITPAQQSNPALRASSDYQQILPNSYYQGGIQLRVGDAIQEYSSRWRPYFFGSIYYNTLTKFSNNVKVGINGSVLGRDSLLVYAEYGTAPAAASATTSKIGMRYVIYF